jgi:MFS family permease
VVLLGTVSFAGQIPSLFLAPVAGVLVDRWNRHRTLVATQIVAMLQSFAMAGLALSGLITVGHIVTLAVVQGDVNAFDMPACQSFVLETVENGADLPNAIALNSSVVNGAGLIGSALAGVIISTVGEAWCFARDGVSYLAVTLSLMSMRVVRRSPSKQTRRVGEQLREGWTMYPDPNRYGPSCCWLL